VGSDGRGELRARQRADFDACAELAGEERLVIDTTAPVEAGADAARGRPAALAGARPGRRSASSPGAARRPTSRWRRSAGGLVGVSSTEEEEEAMVSERTARGGDADEAGEEDTAAARPGDVYGVGAKNVRGEPRGTGRGW
jgi:hypothetical protein